MSGASLPEPRVLDDAEQVARAGASLFEEAARDAIAARDRFVVALAGGSTPRRMYEVLAAEAQVDWAKVEIFWGDERCVPPTDARSNYHMAAEALLNRVRLQPGHVHRVHGELGAAAGATAYGDELCVFFAAARPAAGRSTFDLVLLGLGEDGHTASLFPRDAALEATGWAAAAVAPVGTPAHERVTLTLPAIAGAEQVLFLVTGAGKATIARRVLSGDRSLPATRVSARGRVSWLLDREAAAGLHPQE